MAKLIQCNVPSTNIRRSRAFYRALFADLEFARSLSDEMEAYHKPISVDGIKLTISPRQDEQEQITCYFAVDNLDETLTALEQMGGTVIVEPFTLYTSPEAFPEYESEVRQYDPEARPSTDIGQSALVRDPDGNLIGLTELREDVYRTFKYGKFRVDLEAEQVAQHRRALELAKLLKPIRS